jgi:hypothetical protein
MTKVVSNTLSMIAAGIGSAGLIRADSLAGLCVACVVGNEALCEINRGAVDVRQLINIQVSSMSGCSQT